MSTEDIWLTFYMCTGIVVATLVVYFVICLYWDYKEKKYWENYPWM